MNATPMEPGQESAPNKPEVSGDSPTNRATKAGRPPITMSDAQAEQALEDAAKSAAKRREQSQARPIGQKIARPEIDESESSAEETERLRRIDERQREMRAKDLVRAANIPKRYENFSLGDIGSVQSKLSAADRAAIEKAANDLRSAINCTGPIVMLGARGTGKTHLACCVVREFCARGLSARYATTADYLLAITSTFDGRGIEVEVFRHFCSPQLLVLDEFHERTGGKWDDLKLTQLVDRRYAEQRPTLLISNLTCEEFEKSAGASIVSRVHDGGKLIECNWRSLRVGI